MTGSLECPFCDAPKPELVSLFGSQLLFSQYRCRACGAYFEGVRDDRRENQPAPTEGEATWQSR
jgi:hypothetical protein